MKRVATVFLLLTTLALAVPAAEPPVSVWAVPSVQKVRPEDPVEASNLVWSGKTKTVTISGAKNEHVPFQIVVTTPPPPTRYDRAASGFRVDASDLISPSGRITKERIKLYLEHVVLCYGKSSPVGATGFWPDALVPLTGPFGMDSQFRSFVRNRAIWIDVQVPEEYASDLVTTFQISPHQASKFIVSAEKEFRKSIILYGKILTQDEPTAIG